MPIWPIVQGLTLVMVANGTPLLAKKVFGAWGAWPLDFGARFVDGRPLLGTSKTIRGLLLALVATAGAAPLLGLPWQVGALAGAAAMAGDLLSSFIKRRLGLAPESMALGLDQAPESLLPLLACKNDLGLATTDVLAATALFWAGELALSRALYALNIRDRPY
ncbi:CDP-archaeol synthase [Methylocapsa aurea]|uniref:CDP-archaeol synthase n=1 Tax=Methylocapsa aurea TaxID=663610 RepID=UPI00056B8B1A|nr:CDP-archaeol synthase [Methylocapsa aurea]